MTPWFLQNDNRITQERAAINSLDNRSPWLKGPVWAITGGNLTLLAEIEIGNDNYSIILEYPTIFPAAPPTVAPRNSGERWSTHQYSGRGDLCLEWGPDNWEPHITGSDLLESAYKLLSTETSSGEDHQREVASRHETSIGQDLRGTHQRVAISSECETFLASLPEGTIGIFDFRVVIRDGNATVHVQSIKADGFEPWTSRELPKALNFSRGYSHKGRFACANIPDFSFGGESFETLRSELEKCGCENAIEPVEDDFGDLILLLRDNLADVRALWLINKNGDRIFQLPTIHTHAVDGSRTGASRDAVSGKRVGIVGLGSVGSKIALSLARSGVSEFLLVDDDIFLPENLERHTLDYRNVGEHKVDGVAGQLEALTADINVEVSRIKVTGQEASSSVSYRLEQLSRCDVVIDATADPRTFNQLAAVVGQAATAMVWCEVFAGGIGGMIARYRPGKDPDPFTIRAVFHSYLEDKEPAPGVSSEPYQGLNTDGEPMIATDTDVAIIAHHAARVAFDIIEGREPPVYPNSLYLIGLERRWIFEAPFHTIGIDVGEPKETPTDEKTPLSSDNITFLAQAFERSTGGNTN